MGKQVKKINKRTVRLITLGIMIIITILIGVMIWATSQKDPTIYARQGDQFMKEGKYEEAARAYGKAFRYSKKDPSWLLKIADAYYRLGEIGRALGALENAIIMDPTLTKAQEKIVDIYYKIYGRNAPPASMARLEEAAEKLLNMLPKEKAETDPEVKRLLAKAYHCLGIAKYARRAEAPELEKEAIEYIQKAIDLQPLPEYVNSMAYIYTTRAVQLAKLATSPDTTLVAYREYVNKMYEELEKAENIYKNLLKQNPEDYETYLAISEFYMISRGNTEKMLSNFCNFQARYINGRIAALERELNKITSSQELSSTEKRQKRLSILRDISNLRSEGPEWANQAQNHLERYIEYLNKAKEHLDIAQKYAKSKDAHEKIYIDLANYYLLTDDLKKAQEASEAAIKAKPESYIPYKVLAAILQERATRSKDEKEKKSLINEAISTLRKRIYDIPHNFSGPEGNRNRLYRADLITNLVNLYIIRNDKGDAKTAESILSGLEKEIGESYIIYELKGRIAILQNKLVEAIQSFEKADQLSNGQNATIKLTLAKLYLVRKEIGAARNAIDEALKLNPSSIEILKLAANIYLNLNEPEKAIAFAEQVLSDPHYQNDKQMLIVKLEALIRANKMQEADEVVKQLKMAGVDINWDLQKSRIYITRREYSKAEELLKSILSRNPKDKTAAIYLADVYQRVGRNKEAKKLLQETLKYYPDDERLKILAELVNITDPDERAKKFEEIREQIAQEAMAKILASADEEKDEYAKTIKLFNYYLMAKDYTKAEEYLDKAMKINPERTNEIAFRYALLKKQWDRAEKCIEFAIKNNLDGLEGKFYQARYYNARGWSNVNSGNIEKAKEEFNKSLSYLKDIVSVLPNDSTARALLAEAYYWTGNITEATPEAKKALELNPENGYSLRAWSLILWDKIEKLPVPNPEDIIDFSKTIVSAYNKLPLDEWISDKRKWLDEIVEKQREQELDVKGNAEEALKKRLDRFKENPNDVENLLRIAWIYENRKEVRDLAKANEFYQKAIEKSPRGIEFNAYFAFLKRNNMLKEGEEFFKKFAEKLAKEKSGRGYALLSNFYLNVGNIKLAEETLKKVLEIEDTPSNRLVLARFYRAIGEPQNAAEWAEKAFTPDASAKDKKEARFIVIESLLEMKEWEKAETRINEYIKEYPDEPFGYIYKAQLETDRDNMAEAEKILTELLKKEPNSILVRQMLARVYIFEWKLTDALQEFEYIKRLAGENMQLKDKIDMIKVYCELGDANRAEQETRNMISSMARASISDLELIRLRLLRALSGVLDEKQYDELLVWASSMFRQYWGWQYERGMYWLEKGNILLALDAFENAWNVVRQSPQINPNIKAMVASDYLKAMFKARAYDKLINFVDNTPKDISSHPVIFSWKAAALIAKNDLKGATENILQLIKNTSSPQLISQIVENILLKAITPDRLLKILSQDKENANTKYAIAQCLFAEGKTDEAMKVYEELIKNTEDRSRKLTLMSILSEELTNSKRYDQAIEWMKKILKMDPDNIAINNNIAYVLAEYLDRPKEAIGYIKKLAKLYPNNPHILDTYGQVLAKMGQTDKAILAFSKSIWIRESAEVRYHLATTLLKEGKKSEAHNQLMKALKLVGSNKDLEDKIKEALLKT